MQQSGFSNNLTKESIQHIANSFKESRILLTAVELDIFTLIEGHLLSSNEIAIKIGADERATDRLLNALTTIGLVRKVKGKFYNTDLASQYLVKGKENFMAGLMHTVNTWESWNTLTDVVRKGKSIHADAINERGENWLNSFIAAMHHRGVEQAKILSYLIDLTDAKTMLDIGGGSGAFSMGFMNVNKNLQATIFDLPNVIPITKKYVKEEGFSDKVSFIAGDYLTNDLGKDYDLIFLSAIVHINSYEENAKLVKKCTDALNANGQIVIKDYIMNEDRTSPESGALFAINMLVGTECGDTYTEKEIKEWMESAGLHSIERKDTSFGSSLMIGRKQ